MMTAWLGRGEEATHETGIQLFPGWSVGHILLLLGVFILAFGMRLDGISQPPMDYNPAKQYRSAMVARYLFFQMKADVPQWELEVARANVEELGMLVPPIPEIIAALAYRVVGEERLWIPRLLSVVCWMIGGLFIYRLAWRIGTPDAAIFSTAIFLLLPEGVRASQSFQPDGPMVVATIVSIYAILRHRESSNWLWLVVAGLLSALAIMLKGVAVFFTVGAFLGLSTQRRSLGRALDSQTLTFLLLSVLPTILFYLYVASQGVLKHSAMGFLPHLLWDPLFWMLWLKQVDRVFGFPLVVAALLGLLVVRRDYRVVLLLSIWAAYISYGIVKNYHIHTHPYYQLPLVPVIALSAGPTLALITSWLAEHRTGRLDRLAATCIAVLTLVLSFGVHVRDQQRRPDFAEEVRIAEEIGEVVHHSRRVIVLGPTEERPLRYHGKFAGTYWPDLGEITAETVFGLDDQGTKHRLLTILGSLNPEYFVVRNLAEFSRQHELSELLSSRYRILKSTDDYLVFDLRHSDDKAFGPSSNQNRAKS